MEICTSPTRNVCADATASQGNLSLRPQNRHLDKQSQTRLICDAEAYPRLFRERNSEDTMRLDFCQTSRLKSVTRRPKRAFLGNKARLLQRRELYKALSSIPNFIYLRRLGRQRSPKHREQEASWGLCRICNSRLRNLVKALGNCKSNYLDVSFHIMIRWWQASKGRFTCQQGENQIFPVSPYERRPTDDTCNR